MIVAKLPADRIREDTWTDQAVGTPFPDFAVKVDNQMNMYVALWYRHGRPIMGRAWNDSGVVCCEFADADKTFSGGDVGGTIQLLIYQGNHVTRGFFYEWQKVMLWKNELTNPLAIRKNVRCGVSACIYYPEHKTIGNYDMEQNKAFFSIGGKFVQVSDNAVLNEMMILVRNTAGGPPHCPCPACKMKNHTERKPLMVNDWGDFRWGQPWPVEKPLLRALGRALQTPWGPQDQFVSLWYRHGRPLMGRAWLNNNKIDASFSDNGREFAGECVGSLQILVEVPATAAGFDYCWMPYEQVLQCDDKDFAPVHMNFIAPCVLMDEKKYEVLGQVSLKSERAEAAMNGKVMVVEGPKIRQLKVLCRRDRADTICI